MMFDDTLISIHAPTRGATILCNHRGLVFGFQSTLPREERQIPQIDPKTGEQFQSTLPREERQILQKLAENLQNFNPRSHERSDVFQQLATIHRTFISIHAPTRGATLYSFYAVDNWNFNPRSHERSDKYYFYWRYKERISIHAPTRGATNKAEYSKPKTFISIHAPTRGATMRADRVFKTLLYFNPRSHERSDSNIAQKICLFLYNTDNKYIIR